MTRESLLQIIMAVLPVLMWLASLTATKIDDAFVRVLDLIVKTPELLDYFLDSVNLSLSEGRVAQPSDVPDSAVRAAGAAGFTPAEWVAVVTKLLTWLLPMLLTKRTTPVSGE